MRDTVRPAGRRLAPPVVALCLAVAGVLVAGPEAAASPPIVALAEPPPAAALAEPPPTEAADEATAMRLAVRNRRPVEVLDARTETAETYAQPDGTLRTRTHAAPQRVRRGSGWVPVDTTLQLVNGSIVPTATTLDVSFSAGGTGPLVTLVKDGRRLSVSWPYTVRAPALDGDSATYSEVLPGVDLVLTAQPDAFTEVLVVKNATAAQNSRLRSLQFELTSAGGVTTRQGPDGLITAAGPAGDVLFRSDGASMWDAPVALTARSSSIVVQREPRTVRSIPVTLSGSTLTVTPAADMLSSSTVTYPLSIDPGFEGGKEIWTHVSRKNPGTSYWTDSNRKDMRVGQLWGGSSTDDWRTIVSFDVEKLRGTTIRSASVLVNVRHSADCSPSPFQLWRTNKISKDAKVTWNSTKDAYWKHLGTVNATANKSLCPRGNDMVEFGQSAVRSAFQSAADKNYYSITLAFRAKSESDEKQWKKLVPDSTTLDIEYNRKPGKPSGLGFGPCYQACASPAVTSAGRPTLTMKASDPDGGTLRYEYEVYDSTRTTQKAKSGTAVTGVASGASRGWTLKADLADGSYQWRGRACDTYLCGPYSDWYAFQVDSANPLNPTVRSSTYPATGWNGAPGLAGNFTFSPTVTPGRPNTDRPGAYKYSLNGAPETTVTAATSGVATVSIKPAKDMLNTLRVRAVDKAGNISGGADYLFKVAPVGQSWYWSLDEGTGTTATSAPENNRPLTATGSGVTWAANGKDGASSVVLAGTGALTTASTVFDTRSPSGFTVAAWVRLPAPEPVDDDGSVPTGDGTETEGPGDSDPDGTGEPEENEPDGTTRPPAASMTAVSQEGGQASTFRLGYRADLDLDGDGVLDPAWCFTVAGSDVATPALTSACTDRYVEPGAWVHLIGIVNPIDNRIQLYVNGTPARDGVFAEQPGTATWESTGAFAVGRGLSAGVADQRWTGEIDEVRATPRIWTEQEIYDNSHVFDDAAL